MTDRRFLKFSLTSLGMDNFIFCFVYPAHPPSVTHTHKWQTDAHIFKHLEEDPIIPFLSKQEIVI